MFKFTIRELLLLTVIAGLAVGWFCDHFSQAATTDTLARKATVWRWRAEHLVWFLGYEGKKTVKWDADRMTVFKSDGNWEYASLVPDYEPGVPVEQQVLRIGVKDGKWER